MRPKSMFFGALLTITNLFNTQQMMVKLENLSADVKLLQS